MEGELRMKKSWSAFCLCTVVFYMASLGAGRVSEPDFDYIVVSPQAPAHPHAKTVGDLNGDGRPDIVVASSRGGGLHWYEFPGWARHTIVAQGSFTTDMQAADVDGDGDLDIVVPFKEGAVRELRWYENPRPQGDPAVETWRMHPIVDYGKLDFPTAHDVEVGDLNGDGRLDVVLGRQEWKGPRGRNLPEVVVLFQNESASWSTVVLDTTYGEGIALADLDRDGDLDVVRPGYWLEAPPDKGRGPWTRRKIAEAWPDQATIAVADINQDGRPDVILAPAESEGRISWFEAPEDPKSGAWVEHVIADPVGFVHGLKAADMDRDGHIDVIFAEMQQSKHKRVGVYLNVRAGSEWKRLTLAATGSHNIRLSDFDGDGAPDVFGVNWNSETDPRRAPVEIWRNKLFDRRTLPLHRWSYISADRSRGKWGDFDQPQFLRYFGLAMGDLTGDGYQDIVSGRYFYRNPGGEMVGVWPRIEFPINVDAILLPDVDGDGRLDVVAQRLPEVYWLKPSDSSGASWTARVVASVPQTSHRNSQGYVLADIVPGGKPEILLAGGDGIYCIRIPDNPRSQPWPAHRIAAGTADEGIGTGDLDGDGRTDIVAVYGDGTKLAWWRNPGTLETEWPRYPLGATYKQADRIAVLDVNRDGRLDVVVTEEASSQPACLYWFEHPAQGIEEQWRRHTVVCQYTLNSLDVGDLDRDGVPEIVTAEHRGWKRLEIWKNAGEGRAWRNYQVSTGRENHLGARLCDLDNDGDLDIVGIAWDNYQYLHVWRNDARRRMGGAVQVSKPVITPDGGDSDRPFTVTLASATPGATIRYTLDGSEPDLGAALYTEPLILAGSATLKARAFRSGFHDSDVATAVFTTTYHYKDEPMP